MTNLSDTLDPTRPDNGEVGGDMQPERVEAVDGHENEGIENGDAGENDVDRAEAGQELRKPKRTARPNTPTKSELYEHEVTRLTYRSWCWQYVFGRVVSTPHPKPDGKEKPGVATSLDYWFMSGEEAEDPDLTGLLIVLDDSLGAIPVGKKGPVAWMVRWMVEKIDNTV